MFLIHELYDIDRPERHLVATEKEVAKSNLTISKLDVLFAILVSGKLYALIQQDLTRKGSNWDLRGGKEDPSCGKVPFHGKRFARLDENF